MNTALGVAADGPLLVLGAPFGVAMLAGGVAAGALVWLMARDPGRPTTPAWRSNELRELPAGWVPPTGRHRWDAERAAQQISRNVEYLPQHAVEDVPSEIASVTLELPVVDRARVLRWSRSLVGDHGTQVADPDPASPRARAVRRQLALRLLKMGLDNGYASVLGLPPRGRVLP